MKTNGQSKQSENEALPAWLAQLPKKTLAAPEGYYDALQGKLETLLLLDKQPVMEAPDRYFEMLPAGLQQLLLQDKKEPFAANDLYFEQLREATEKLALLRKQEPFVFPDLYVERLQQRLSDKLDEENNGKQTTKIISLQQAIGLASAACVVAAIIYLAGNNGQTAEPLEAFNGTKTPAPVISRPIQTPLKQAETGYTAEKIKQNISPNLHPLPIKNITSMVAPRQYAFAFPEPSSEAEKQALIDALEDYLIAENIDESLLTGEF
jgi:hypothetical protein